MLWYKLNKLSKSRNYCKLKLKFQIIRFAQIQNWPYKPKNVIPISEDHSAVQSAADFLPIIASSAFRRRECGEFSPIEKVSILSINRSLQRAQWNGIGRGGGPVNESANPPH